MKFKNDILLNNEETEKALQQVKVEEEVDIKRTYKAQYITVTVEDDHEGNMLHKIELDDHESIVLTEYEIDNLYLIIQRIHKDIVEDKIKYQYTEN